MTLEEAKQLKPGDIITGSFSGNRKIIKCCITKDHLHWSETNRDLENEYPHSWIITNITLVKASEPVINNTYPIY